MAAMDATQLRELGQQFRVDSIRPAAVAKSGHPTSGMSAADLMAVLVANHFRYDFDHLTAIIDVNRLGQRGETMIGWNTGVYVERARAFGWNAIEVDGHEVEEIDRAYKQAEETPGRPTVIVARTIKGKGVKAVEDKDGWHGKALDDPEAAIAELGGERNIVIDVQQPESFEPRRFETGPLELPRYELGSEVATRKAYGDALVALWKD